MRYLLALTTIVIFAFTNTIQAQESASLASKLKTLTQKGDYAIIEMRLNKEDEFRTIDGSTSSLARIAIFTGNNQGAEVVSKGFGGINSIVSILNDLKKNGWRLVDVYPIKGESLIITHYVIERKK